jgi:hypothetical protein
VSVALVIQQAKRLRRIILSSVACLPLRNFSALSRKRYDFQKIVIEDEICVLIFATNLFETFINLRGIQRDIIINVRRCSCKVSYHILVTFQWGLNFLNSGCMEIRAAGVEFFHADGRTDRQA